VFGVTQNPIVYGEVVPAAAFADRVDELDRLVRDLSAAQKVFLISPRRYGKSSLIRRAPRSSKPEGPCSPAGKASQPRWTPREGGSGPRYKRM